MRTAGDPSTDREPANAVSHELDEHNPAMAFGGRLDPVNRLGRGRERGIDADASIGADDIIVDGLGHSDHQRTSFADAVRRGTTRYDAVRRGERPVATGDNERDDPVSRERVDCVLVVVAVVVRGAEDLAALAQNPSGRRPCEFHAVG
jgi:hypothetical protein